MTYFRITPRDPLVFRDSRPLRAGGVNRMKSLPWPLPSVTAGTLRTLAGKTAAPTCEFNDAECEALRQLAFKGPFPALDGRLFLPAPRDLVGMNEDPPNKRLRVLPLRPVRLPEGAGTDIPGDLLPLVLPEDAPPDKPATLPAFWSWERYREWLLSPEGVLEPDHRPTHRNTEHFLFPPESDHRTHVKIDSTTSNASDGDLFETMANDYLCRMEDGSRRSLSMVVKAEIAGSTATQRPNGDTGRFLQALADWPSGYHRLGGESRLARLETESDSCLKSLETFPEEFAVAPAARSAKYCRMILLSPAVFDEGWRPAWLHSTPEGAFAGTPPGTRTRLKLLAAVVPRWKPASGWDMQRGGPKRIHRLVEAGAVYFFEILEGDLPDLVRNTWLAPLSDDRLSDAPLSDDPQSHRDGFGLVVWGLAAEPAIFNPSTKGTR